MKVIPMTEDRYCQYCGTKLDTDTCPNCGRELDYNEQVQPDYCVGEEVYYKDKPYKVEDMKMMLHPASQLYEDAYKLEDRSESNYIFWEELFHENFFQNKHRRN